MTPLLLGQVSRVSQSLMLMSALLLPGQVVAQATPNTIKDVTLQALDSNPEVQAAWHEFKAATQDVRVARGGYLPTVDIGASAGKTNRDYDGRGVYNTTQGQITLSQMLFDGFRTSGQVERFDSARLVRYYELACSAIADLVGWVDNGNPTSSPDYSSCANSNLNWRTSTAIGQPLAEQSRPKTI